jgi:hypothetical protein
VQGLGASSSERAAGNKHRRGGRKPPNELDFLEEGKGQESIGRSFANRRRAVRMHGRSKALKPESRSSLEADARPQTEPEMLRGVLGA